MKKLLLSAAILAACAGSASAQSFEFYATTDISKGYKLVQEGDVIEVPTVVEEPNKFEFDGVVYVSQAVESMLYAYMANKTSHDWSVSDKNSSPAISYVAKERNDIVPAGYTAPETLTTCLGGGCWITNPFYINCPANSETEQLPGNHLGLDMNFDEEGLAEQVKFNSTYDFTITLGSETLHFTVKYGAGEGSVAGVNADLNTPKEYYNLQGIKVVNPEKGGIYIVKQGNKVSKQVIR